MVTQLDARLGDDIESDRARLRRWHRDGEIRIVRTDEGPIAKGTLLPWAILLDGGAEKGKRLGHREDGQALSNFRSGGSFFASIYRVSRRNFGASIALRTLTRCDRTRAASRAICRRDFGRAISELGAKREHATRIVA